MMMSTCLSHKPCKLFTMLNPEPEIYLCLCYTLKEGVLSVQQNDRIIPSSVLDLADWLM